MFTLVLAILLVIVGGTASLAAYLWLAVQSLEEPRDNRNR
jgi:hypothetical protein